MRTNLFASMLGLLTFAACESDSSKEGMQTTELGNRYTYVTTNDDGQLPQPGEYVYFDALIKTENDSVIIDTREGGPENQPYVMVMADSLAQEEMGPVEDIARKLRVGERAVIRHNISEIPPQARPMGMQSDTVLLYDIEVTSIMSQEAFMNKQAEMQAEMQAKAELVRARTPEMLDFSQQVYEDYKAGNLDDQLQTTPSGLRYVIHEEGSGKEAEAGRGVVVQYIGRLSSNGEVFDQSFERGQGIPFPLGQGRVIPGWDEGIDLLQEGDRATFIIPSELAYGEQGSGATIPPGSELLFYVELEKVQ